MTVGRRPEMGKYLLYKFFSQHPYVQRYLPRTVRYSHASFREFLGKYKVLYVKPVAGQQGKGIMKAWKQGSRIYVKHTVKPAQSFPTVDAALTYIDRARNSKIYIVQRAISLFTVKGRPVDIRVMMQRSRPGGEWVYSGMVAKVAGAGSVVTNIAMSRGTVMDVETALKTGLGYSSTEARSCMKKLKDLCFKAAGHFDSYQRYRELGFDVGIDASGRIWLIEQNTAPSHRLFAKLKTNLSMYRQIEHRWAQYQRVLRKHA